MVARSEWRKWDGEKLAGVWDAGGLVAQELYAHAGGWPADTPGAFDYEQVITHSPGDYMCL